MSHLGVVLRRPGKRPGMSPSGPGGVSDNGAAKCDAGALLLPIGKDILDRAEQRSSSYGGSQCPIPLE